MTDIHRDTDLIWRIEQANGDGPYQSRGVVRCYPSEGEYVYGDEHPTPGSDGIHGEIHKRRFGFASIKLARRWWYSLPDLMTWEDHGVRLVAYRRSRCVDVEDGRSQTVFHPHPGKPASFPCSHLHSRKIADLVSFAAAHFTQEGDYL